MSGANGRTPVIVGATRTAIGTFGGALAEVPATTLGSEVIKEALRVRRDRPDGTATARPINVSTSTFRGALHDFVDRPVRAWVRSSVHYYNSEEELGEFLGAVRELAKC